MGANVKYFQMSCPNAPCMVQTKEVNFLISRLACILQGVKFVKIKYMELLFVSNVPLLVHYVDRPSHLYPPIRG